MVNNFPILFVQHSHQFAKPMEFAVVKFSKIGDSIGILQTFEDIDAHAMHCIFFPEANVFIPILKDIDAIAVLDIIIPSTNLLVKVQKSVLLLHLQIYLAS